ncbi:hypothetical protein CUR178_05997 [Leishmania enriettii]|uniref:CFA20 domain-containing protein n=1 Tax=Leishmania enriettii TaxID=5663 RepID=A0A836HSI6_LEIEN|nr:hypothetical protein CUR178_05997 [Leishmania enriettii]
MNGYFFSHNSFPPPSSPPLVHKTAISAGVLRQGPRQSQQRQELTLVHQDAWRLYGKGEGRSIGSNSELESQQHRETGYTTTSNVATPPSALRVEPAAMGTKRLPNGTHASPSLRSISPAASVVSATPHCTAPCLVLFSPRGPRPLQGLKTVTAAPPGNAAAVAPGRGHLRTHGASLNRLSAGSSPTLSAVAVAALDAAAGRRTAKHATVSVAARESGPSSSGIRCVYDRDTRSQLLHIAPGTEVDFSSCMRLPALAVAPAPAAGTAATPVLLAATALHTILAVQFCVAAPILSAAVHRTGSSRPQLPASPCPPPGSFHIELVLRTGASSNTAGRRGSTNGSSSSGSGGGYRLRFTNTGHNAQRHTHHTKIPLQCVRTAQWVQLFLDLEALLQSCQAAGAVVAGGPHCRLQQLRIGSCGSAASTGGIYVRRIIAGRGLPLPHSAIDHLFSGDGTTGKMVAMGRYVGSEKEMARNADEEGRSSCRGLETLQQCSGSCWVTPEALRLPAEAGESLCVFVRTGDEYILSEAPALPAFADAPSLEDEVHARGRDNAEEATQARCSVNNCAGVVSKGTTGWASDATHDAARRRAPQSDKEALTEPRTSSSAVLPLHHSQRRQSNAYPLESPSFCTSHQSNPEGKDAAPRKLERQSNPLSVQHHTALEMLRMRDHQSQSKSQPVHQLARSGAAARSSTPDDPQSSSFSPSSSSPSSPNGASYLSASDDAEMFVVREVSAAEQLAPVTPPQYPANQLMTGKPPLRRAQPLLPVATEVRHDEKNEEHMGKEVEGEPVRKDVALEDACEAGFSACAAVGAASLISSACNSTALTTTATTPEASVLSDVSYSFAVELMEEMGERVRRIHMVLAGANEEAAAARAAATSTVTQSVIKSPSSHHATLPSLFISKGARPSVKTAIQTALSPLEPPPPLTDAPETDSPSSPLSAPVQTALDDLVKAVLSDPSSDAVGSTAAIPCTPSKTPTAVMETAKCDSVLRAEVEDGTAAALRTSEDTNAILELWSSAEMPLRLPAVSQPPATAAAQCAPLAGRLREHQTAFSSPPSAAFFSHVDGGDNGGVGGVPSGAISPPVSAATSWTFRSASLTQQTPSVLRPPTTPGAIGEPLPRAGGASANYPAGAKKGIGQPPLRQAWQPWTVSHTRATELFETVIPPSKPPSGEVTKAVVWRRPVPVPGHPPSLGDATQRALQDEVRLTDTPLSRLAGAPGAGNAGARHMVAWSARQNADPNFSGTHTSLSTAVSSHSGAAPHHGSRQVFIDATQLSAGAHVPPLPPSGRSFSTVSSFHMWLPSSLMHTLSASCGRYPSTTTPSSGRNRHADPPSGSSAGAGGGPPPPRLSIAAAPSCARLPLTPLSTVHMPGEALDRTEPTSSAEAAIGKSPLAQQQQQQTLDFPVAALSRDSPHHASAHHCDALPRAATPPPKFSGEEGRYMYDCVLQCYLDLTTNSYVDRV